MSIGLIAWGRFFDAAGNRVTVPAPSTEPGVSWLVDFVRSQAAGLGASFDYVQWPPWSKAWGGAAAGCDGYGVFDRRDLGTKPQQGSVATRYGTLEGLMAAIAALNAHGCGSLGDLVLHQLMGENCGIPGMFSCLGADGVPRIWMQASYFRGRTSFAPDGVCLDPVPPFCLEDDVPSRRDDVAFGREVSYQHCTPPGLTVTEMMRWVAWLRARTGAAGFRIDDVKGIWPQAVRSALMAAGEEKPYELCYAEYFDGDPAVLDAWARGPAMRGLVAVEDFALHFRIQAACNGYDARLLEAGGAGYWERCAGLAVGFVDNPDTDTSPGQQVVANKGLAYAYLLTLPLRLALVYGKDYFGANVWPGAYGLRSLIDNLCWINRMFAFGSCVTQWCDEGVYVLSRDGNGGPVGWSGGLLTALNFDTQQARTITCATPFAPHRRLHDYTGRHGDIWTDAEGRATFTIPANRDSRGESFLCFSGAGVSKPYPVRARATRQVFQGRDDLDVLAVRNGMQVLPQRLHCAAGTLVTVAFGMRRIGVSRDATVQVELVGPDGKLLGWATTGGLDVATVSTSTLEGGWLTVRLVGNLLPASGVGFTVTADYTGEV